MDQVVPIGILRVHFIIHNVLEHQETNIVELVHLSLFILRNLLISQNVSQSGYYICLLAILEYLYTMLKFFKKLL